MCFIIFILKFILRINEINDRFIFLDLASIGAGYGLNLLEKRPLAPRRTLRELLPPNISSSALNLINTLIVFNPNNRLTAVQALEHSYVAE